MRRSYQQHWSGHSPLPSLERSSQWRQHCWPDYCGSAAAGDTPPDQWRLLHEEVSCTNHQNVDFMMTFSYTLSAATLVILSYNIYLFLLSLALTIAEPRVSINISAALSLSWILRKGNRKKVISFIYLTNVNGNRQVKFLTQHSGGGWRSCPQPCERFLVLTKPPHMYHDLWQWKRKVLNLSAIIF